MNVLFPVLVTFFAGMGAGLGTGFAGMSAGPEAFRCPFLWVLGTLSVKSCGFASSPEGGAFIHRSVSCNRPPPFGGGGTA